MLGALRFLCVLVFEVSEHAGFLFAPCVHCRCYRTHTHRPKKLGLFLEVGLY